VRDVVVGTVARAAEFQYPFDESRHDGVKRTA
jgi:hypothetical protein